MVSEINKIFKETYQKSKDFNSRIYMRYYLWKVCGYKSDDRTLPGFLDLEQMSISGVISILHYNGKLEEFLK